MSVDVGEIGLPAAVAPLSDHIGRLFLRAHRDFSERAIEKLRQRGHDRLGLAHTGLLAHLDGRPTRITTLAERAALTKQAAGQIILDLEAQGYVERAVDPADRRAMLVTFTAAGRRFLRDAAEIKREIEAEYAAILGAERLRNLRAALETLLRDS
jgi:DNA-binding MarR family transcriptional regulator